MRTPIKIYVFHCQPTHLKCPQLKKLSFFLLSDQSTDCGGWLSVVHRRVLSCIRQQFDVYTLEATVVTQFWLNLVRTFFWTISRSSSNLGHVRPKTRSPGQMLENPCLHSRSHIFRPKFDGTLSECFFLTISTPNLNMGHVGSKTRSPGQILETPCLHSWSHICDQMLMKLCQHVYFDNI